MKTQEPYLTRRGSFAALALASCLSALVGPAATAQFVEIPDPELRRMIRLALNKPRLDITVADMESLTELDASWTARGGWIESDGVWTRVVTNPPPIQSLQGLEIAKNLISLNLRGSSTRIGVLHNLLPGDLSLPSTLTRLETLDLAYNFLASLTLPAELIRLKTLDLRLNPNLTNLTLPEGLIRLTTLNLSESRRLTNFAFLSGLTNLESLDLRFNNLTNLTLPEGLDQLTYLNVEYNPLTYLAVPASLNLSQLQIVGFPVDQVTVLVRFGPASLLNDGRLHLQLRGASGQRVHVQHSTNLRDWEDWQTVTLGVTGSELFDQTSSAPQRFYRAIQDKSAATPSP